MSIFGKLHLALEHSNDLLICVTVRLDMTPLRSRYQACTRPHSAQLSVKLGLNFRDWFDERKLSLRASSLCALASSSVAASPFMCTLGGLPTTPYSDQNQRMLSGPPAIRRL